VGRLAEVYFCDKDGPLNGGEFESYVHTIPTDKSWAEAEIKILDLGDIELNRVDEE
jgi:hypothetical protein